MNFVNMSCLIEFVPTNNTDVPCKIPVNLAWTSHDPHTVHATFQSGGEPVVWVFDLDMLAAGMLHPVGEGDVFLAPDFEYVWAVTLVLSNHVKQAAFRVPAEFLADFLVEVDEAQMGVPALVVDWDSEIARWLEAA